MMAILSAPVRRAQRLRRDDQAQVMVLTAVMVFVVAIMGLTTFNAGTMLYNRVKVQTAADASADTFAAYQARGLNLAQHLNDIHYDLNWVLFAGESVAWGVRITCPAQAVRPPPIFFSFPAYNRCCRTWRSTATSIDDGQNMLSEVVLGVQKGINILLPLVGTINANGLAEANGGDKIWTWFGDIVGMLARTIGMNETVIQNAFDGIAAIPYLGDIYVLPVKINQLFDLNIKEKDPDPNDLPWDTKGIVRGLAIISDVACALSGDYAMSREPNHDYGWRDDTFYCGGPSYNTYMVGVQQRNAFPGVEKLAWLNPRLRAREQRLDMYSHQRNYGVFEHRSSSSVRSVFHNPVMYGMASSQVEGSPLRERSSHSSFRGYSTPNLISVHMGEPGSDTDLTEEMVWH